MHLEKLLDAGLIQKFRVVAKLCFESPELKDANGQFRVILGI